LISKMRNNWRNYLKKLNSSRAGTKKKSRNYTRE